MMYLLFYKTFQAHKLKDIIILSKTTGLNITIQAGLRIVNFLDVQFK